jgi:hypothetical protein
MTNLKHKRKKTMKQCENHNALLVTLTEIKTDVAWLKNDREEQKKRYERKRSRIRKIHYGVGVAMASAFWYVFENRESVRLFLREWLR